MKIRKRTYPSGNTGWMLDLGKVNGKRSRLAFPTRQDAEDELARRKAELRRAGEQAFAITDEERHRFVAVRDRLAAAGGTLEQAVEFWLAHAKPGKGKVKLSDLIKLCLEDKEKHGARPRYVSQLKCAAKSFSHAGHADRLVDEITSEDVQAWLRGNEWAPKTWNVYRGDLRTIFQWGLQEGYLTMNVVEQVKPKKLDEGEVEFLKVDQAARLLKRAAAERPGAVRRDARGIWIPYEPHDLDFRDCLAFVVLGLFCGLRPERELGEMTWEDVREDVVIVQGRRAKSRARRVVDLPKNARAWLQLCPSKEGEILPANFRRKWSLLRKEAGLLEDWPHDGLRHTFATMWLAHFGDEKRLQLLMGHESADLIYKHYRGMTTPAEAARFWQLLPGKGRG